MRSVFLLFPLLVIACNNETSGLETGQVKMPDFSGFYECAVKSTVTSPTKDVAIVNGISADQTYYRYLNLAINGTSKVSRAYGSKQVFGQPTEVDWMSGEFRLSDDLTGEKPWDGSTACLMFGAEHPRNSVIGGKQICALAFQPSGSFYKSNVNLVPEAGPCDRINK